MQIVKVKFGQRNKFITIPNFHYCGRQWGGFDSSNLHNPFKVGTDGKLPEVLQKYEDYLRLMVMSNTGIREEMAFLTKDSVLGCWCIKKEVAGERPWSCHCDIIAQVWQEVFDTTLPAE